MSGPQRNPDKLNTIAIVVVGICGAVLVYVTIVALQAFYLNDTSEIQTMADYGGNDLTARSIRSSQLNNIGEYGANPAGEGKPATYRVPVDHAMKLVVEAAKQDPANLVPVLGRSDAPTVQPIFGRPKPLAAPAPAGDAEAPADPATAPADDAAETTPPAAEADAAAAPAAPGAPTGAAPAQR